MTLDDSNMDLAATRLDAAPAATPSSRGRRADLLTDTDHPALAATASGIETAGRLAPTNLRSPSRQRRSNVPASINQRSCGAAPIPASAGADEADEVTSAKLRTPRRKSSRSGGEGWAKADAGSTRLPPDPQQTRARKGAVGQAKTETRTDFAAPAPTSSSAPVEGRGDQTSIDTRRPGVAAAADFAGHGPHVSHDGRAGEGDDAGRSRPDPFGTGDPVIAEIVSLWRMRTRWWKAELKLNLQAQALCRGWTAGDKAKAGALFASVRDTGAADDPILLVALAPFLAAMKPFAEDGAAYERRIAKLARSLPVWAAWGKGVWGFSDLALAKIVGEAGDIGVYVTTSGLWKRCGLAVIDGGRQRKVADAEAALAHGYSPQRRSVLWNIGNGVIGGMGKGVRPLIGEDWRAREDWTPYQKLYVERLIHEAERDPEAHARPATAAGKMSFSRHAHNRAKRHVEKRLLRDLRAAWRAAGRGQAPHATHALSAPAGGDPSEAA